MVRKHGFSAAASFAGLGQMDDLRESPVLVILDLLLQAGARVAYHDPYFPTVKVGPHHDVELICTPLNDLCVYDCMLIATNHSQYDYERIAGEAQLVVDTRNATSGIKSPNIVHC